MTLHRWHLLTLMLLASIVTVALAPNVAAQAIEPATSNAPFVTNLGRTVLSRTPLIVTGTLGQSMRRIGNLCQRDLVVERTLWGHTVHPQLTILYENASTLEEGRQRVALCLNPIETGSSSCRITAKPMYVTDPVRVDAVAAYCRIESSSASTVDRTHALRDLLIQQIIQGGAAAQFAAVELIYLVQRNYEVFWHSHYDTLIEAARNSDRRVKADVNLALRGMVELVLKPDTQVEIKSETLETVRVDLARRLEIYLRDFPAAFGEDDAARCGMIAVGASSDLVRILSTHRERILRLVEARRMEAEQQANPWLQRGDDWLSRELARRRQRDATGETQEPDFSTKPFGLDAPPAE